MTPRTPVLVGIGVATQREDDPARALEPLDLMLAAVRNAGADALAAPAPLLVGVGSEDELAELTESGVIS